MSKIFIESKTVIGTADHLYLVYQDDNNDEFVIRGGPTGSLFSGFGAISVEVGVPIELSEDNRGTDTPAERGQRELNFGSRSADDIWAIMLQHAAEIHLEGLKYNAKVSAQNSNSTVASILNVVGLDVSSNLPYIPYTTVYPGLTNLLRFDYSLNGQNNGDLIRGYIGSDLFSGENGTDTLEGGDGDDTLFGGSGNDSLYGGKDKDELHGDSGNDSLYGGEKADDLDGGDGSDKLFGGSGNDILYGGDGNEVVDTLDGGSGSDTYIFDKFSGTDHVFDSDGAGILRLEYNNVKWTLSGVTSSPSSGVYQLNFLQDFSTNYMTAELVWSGSSSVEGSSGILWIDYDPEYGSSADDIIIHNFKTNDFGIVLKDAAGSNENGGNPVIPLTRPTADNENWVGGTVTEYGGIGNFTAHKWAGGSIFYAANDGEYDLIRYNVSQNELQINTIDPNNSTQTPYITIAYADEPEVNAIISGMAGNGSGSYWDPHLVTFDGLVYDFQDGGEFNLIKSTDSNDFTVQVRQKIWDEGSSPEDKFSVNTAVATELGTTTIGIYTPGSLPWDSSLYALDESPYTNEIPALYIGDEAIILPSGGLLFFDDGIVYRSGNSYSVINEYGDGFVADVYDDLINVSTFLSSSRSSGTVEGLLGNFDGDYGNDIALEDGTILGTSLSADLLYDSFGEDWRITQGESLFLYGSGENTSTWNYAGFDNSYLTLDDFDSGDVTTATAAAITAGFDENSDIFNMMVMDFLIMGGTEFSLAIRAVEERELAVADISDDITSNVIMGTSGGDYIVGTVDEDHIIALAGNDTVYGRQEADTILGGTGNDSLYGEGGSDTYIHNKGDGDDYILSVAGDLSKVVMSGVSEDKLYLNVSGYHLYATDVDTGEQLQLVNQYYGIGSGFKIGTVNGINVATALHVKGSSATAGEVIYATIGSGDTLEGGLGNDTLYGNGGTDIFLHNIGDGNDVLNSSNAALSTVEMVGVNPWDIRLEVSSYNVLAINKNNGETLTLTQQLYGTGSGYKFDNINGINLIGGLELEGDDTAEAILGTVNADTITGSEGNDTITGGGGADLFVHEVGDGNDTLIVNSGDLATIAIYGVATSDLRFNVSGYNLFISNVVNSEVITLQNQFHNLAYGYKFASVNGIDLTTGLTIEGGSSADTLNGTDQADSILGGAGADTIHGGLGDDTLIGGLDNDSVYGDGGTDVFIHDSGDGSDLLYENPDAEAIVIMNGVSNSNIYFTTNGYNLYATDVTNGEQLTLYNQYHNLTYGYKFGTLNGMDITGGLVIKGTSATAGEHIKGTTGADTLEGGLGNDTIEGRDGDDIFIHSVGDGNDVLYSWNDAEATITMNGVSTSDILINVSGNNVIITDDATGETLTLINQNYQTNYGYKFASVNGINLMGGLEITGDDSNNLLYGTANADTITGGEGNDTLYGNGGADSFVHEIGDGNDVLYTNYANLATVTFVGVSSDDLLFSASGYHLIVTDTNTGETIQLTNQYHNIAYGYKFASVNGVAVNGGLITDGTDNADSITGSYYADSIGGGLGADTLKGNSGDDTLYGGDGNDSLSGESNDDVLYGNDGNDTLNGGAHNDTLEGGAGDDSLTGSSQNDVFVFIGSDTGDDTITDFYSSQDLLQFDSGIFATAAAAVSAFSSGVIDLGGGNSVILTGVSTLVEADVEII